MGVGEVLDDGLNSEVDLFPIGVVVEWERDGDDAREHPKFEVSV